jgi:malonyl CoA-acyl carrier protein transacylase
VGLFAVFGGQGVQWLGELRTLYFTYTYLRKIVERSAQILQEQARSIDAKDEFGQSVLL